MKNVDETISRLLQILDMCDIHLKRMKYVQKRFSRTIPLNKNSCISLSKYDITIIDQMIYRFTKLQDTMGEKLFPQTLKSLVEEYSEKPFIDLLNRLEKPELIPDHQQWIMMREVRNQLSYEYPSETEEIGDGLNSLYSNVTVIDNIYTDLRKYLHYRFQV